MIGGFRSVLCVSVFPGSSLVIVIMIDSSEKRNCKEGFFLTFHMFVKSAVSLVKKNWATYTLLCVLA